MPIFVLMFFLWNSIVLTDTLDNSAISFAVFPSFTRFAIWISLAVSRKLILHVVEDWQWRRVTAKGRVLKRVTYDTVLTKFTKIRRFLSILGHHRMLWFHPPVENPRYLAIIFNLQQVTIPIGYRNVKLLDTPEVPASLKVAWNDQIKALLPN